MPRKLSPLILVFVLSIFTLQTISGVMQITLNNLKNVLATYQSVHVLFHNPQCIHSRKYVEQFLKITSPQQQQIKLGIVDCIRQLQLCQQYNLKMFPVLAKFTTQTQNDKDNRFQLIDEQKFLFEHNVKSAQDDEVMANRFVNYLTSQPHYAVVVFQDYALPVIQSQRISSSLIFYLQPFDKQSNPSEFTKLLSSFVSNRHGCWIFKKLHNNQLEKYACDSGYSKNITLKYIKLFTQGKLKKYTPQEQSKDRLQGDPTTSIRNINTDQMIKILTHQTHNNISPCALVYISSKHCVSCTQKDTQNILMAVKLLNLSNLEIFKFDLDQNQIPSSLVKLGLRRVPELIYLCDKKVNIFGKVLFIQNIVQFVEDQQNAHLSQQDQTQEKFQTKEQF